MEDFATPLDDDGSFKDTLSQALGKLTMKMLDHLEDSSIETEVENPKISNIVIGLTIQGNVPGDEPDRTATSVRWVFEEESLDRELGIIELIKTDLVQD